MVCCCSDKRSQLLCLFVCIRGQILSQATNTCAVVSIAIYRSKYGKKVELTLRPLQVWTDVAITTENFRKKILQYRTFSVKLIGNIEF